MGDTRHRDVGKRAKGARVLLTGLEACLAVLALEACLALFPFPKGL